MINYVNRQQVRNMIGHKKISIESFSEIKMGNLPKLASRNCEKNVENFENEDLESLIIYSS